MMFRVTIFALLLLSFVKSYAAGLSIESREGRKHSNLRIVGAVIGRLKLAEDVKIDGYIAGDNAPDKKYIYVTARDFYNKKSVEIKIPWQILKKYGIEVFQFSTALVESKTLNITCETKNSNSDVCEQLYVWQFNTGD